MNMECASDECLRHQHSIPCVEGLRKSDHRSHLIVTASLCCVVMINEPVTEIHDSLSSETVAAMRPTSLCTVSLTEAGKAF